MGREAWACLQLWHGLCTARPLLGRPASSLGGEAAMAPGPTAAPLCGAPSERDLLSRVPVPVPVNGFNWPFWGWAQGLWLSSCPRELRMREEQHPTETRHAVPRSRLPKWQLRLCPAPVFALNCAVTAPCGLHVCVCTLTRRPFGEETAGSVPGACRDDGCAPPAAPRGALQPHAAARPGDGSCELILWGPRPRQLFFRLDL